MHSRCNARRVGNIQIAMMRLRSLFYQPFLASPSPFCLLGIGADKSAVSGKRMTTNKKHKRGVRTKLLIFKSDKAIFVNSAARCCPSLDYHFKRYIEKTIFQLTGLTGAGGTEELSSDRICVLIGL